MRRTILSGIVLVTGLVVLGDLLIVNPSLEGAASAVNELLVLLAAAAAVGGGATLVAHHARTLAAGGGDSPAQPLPDGGPVGVGGSSPVDAGATTPITTD